MKNVITIDVEDWFHILELDTTPKLEEWSALESRVEKNFLHLLDILDEAEVKATCFFLGWIAEHHPHLVKEAQRRGHEVACHGYAHQLIYTQTEAEFKEDIRRAKQTLEDLCGEAVIGFRAPGFSITTQTPWALPGLAEAGYRYDSSLFPVKRAHGYFLEAKLYPYRIEGLELYEFPITVANFLSRRICFFGGGYLRLFPYFLIEQMAQQVTRENRPVIYYIHPREIDIHQPRLKMNLSRQFRSYVNLQTTEPKLRKIVRAHRSSTLRDYLRENQSDFVRAASQ